MIYDWHMGLDGFNRHSERAFCIYTLVSLSVFTRWNGTTHDLNVIGGCIAFKNPIIAFRYAQIVSSSSAVGAELNGGVSYRSTTGSHSNLSASLCLKFTVINPAEVAAEFVSTWLRPSVAASNQAPFARGAMCVEGGAC
jgi:hypothetical protein